MRKNKRKIQALELLKNHYPYQPADIAYQLGISTRYASKLLRGMWKQGLARRKKGHNGIDYWITEKGAERLKYLKRQRIKEIQAFFKQ